MLERLMKYILITLLESIRDSGCIERFAHNLMREPIAAAQRKLQQRQNNPELE